MGVFSSQEKFLLLLQFLRYLRTFQGPSWLLCFLSLECCYICYFCDFCDICHGCFKLARKILVTFAIFAIFADISGPFLASSFSKSWFLLDLLFLRFLRYLSWVFVASKKNPCYICHGCFQLARKILVTFAIFAIFKDISGRFLASLLSKSWILSHLFFFWDFCDICHGCF